MARSDSDSPPRRQRDSRYDSYRVEKRDKERGRSRSREKDRQKRERSVEGKDRRHRDRRRSTSREEAHGKDKYRRSREDKDKDKNDRDRKRSRSPRRRSPEAGPLQRKGPLPSQVDAFKGDKDTPSPGPEKQKPSFRPSGLLAAASNTIATSNGNIVLKYHEPPEARKPPSSQHWRLYIFKGDEILDTLDLYAQSCWLFGREVSFRYIERRNEFGDKVGKVKPYIIDLESGNGTKLNEEPLPEGRYMELRDKDVIKFGHSTREYVVQLPPPG
ncbi:hypothetical protein LTR47_000338 [Exophiala xenobiotica]|uniref:FHA domain-containing protein n=1 Tax=Vermiconidia calcicola TaxID=1690605 RepID=A0AAV9Q0U0_9PEZI|nr:hypothetical protein LTR41_004117 [Exophiala xenobiotica]KAK5530796.1 hypothetical protein LTR25_008653 [Vermiconidia calcicola]KAK5238595.1 hypothetical protein LTR47_000338 [Exophiala xenobiotica]KAK5246235.1 hypothetical protein LTS06_008470 [Exophiala xenobiotica]KAK5349681.1 hypothetical protein LTR61_006387 [Exophiala xenobiotica]